MKKKSLIEAVPPEAQDFIKGITPKPQFVQRQPAKAEGEAAPVLIPKFPRIAVYPGEKREGPASGPVLQQPADETPSPVLVPQTFRLPERLIEDLARAGELRALSWRDRDGNIWLPLS